MQYFLLLSLLVALCFTSYIVQAELPTCQVYTENRCAGNEIVTDPSFEDHKWFTPGPKDAGYKASFQRFDVLAAHVHLTYDATHSSVTAEVIGEHRDKLPMTYLFDGVAQNATTKTFYASKDMKPVSISVKGQDGATINLDPIDFIWSAPAVAIPAANAKGDYRNGQKGSIVEFFMWPHSEIEKECAMLAKMGYMGAKMFPVQEQVMSLEPFNNDLNPWYFAYQPVSYRLQGRMGNRDDLRKAIHTCRSYGVRMYADAVLNHMTGGGNDANEKHRNPNAGCATWGGKNSSLNMNSLGTAPESGPSPMYTQSYVYTEGSYTKKPPSQEFPAAHLGPTDFHCERSLNSWTDPLTLNAGWLSGLTDINTEKENVQQRIADYLTDLLSIGFSGFRMDAAKHISPDDIVGILTKLRNNLGGKMPDDWITWLEVLLGGEGDMLMCNVNSGYNYGGYLESALYKAGWSAVDVEKVKIWNSGYPKEPNYGFCTISATRNAIQNDDADQQTSGSTSRDMGDQGCVLIEGCTASNHRNFEVKLFQNPNGAQNNDNDYPVRMVLSSYYWQGQASGVPDGLSDCSKCTINCASCRSTTTWPAYKSDSCGYDSTYTRPHRDLSIVNAMRGWMHLPAVTSADLGLSC